MKLGIMQPYLFPYLGYFQLINLVDKFVIYDDVQFIKGGWINRNKILINGKESMITLKIKRNDFTLNINKRFLVDNYEHENNKIVKSIELAYSKAPYFNETIRLIKDILQYKENNLSQFIINSIIKICKYLDIETEIIVSSNLKKDNSLKAEDKVIYINKMLEADIYVNSIGGTNLYSKENFKDNGLDLYFIKMNNIMYKQFNKDDFISNLSIIDVLMFNRKEKIKTLLEEYELV